MFVVTPACHTAERHGRFQTCAEKAKFFGAGAASLAKKPKKEKGAAKAEEATEEGGN